MIAVAVVVLVLATLTLGIMTLASVQPPDHVDTRRFEPLLEVPDTGSRP